MRKTNKGITLIALIITIIVMLILVAVTVSMAINGGLFDYAGKAVKDTIIAQEKEKIQVGITTSMMDMVSSTGDFTITKETLEKALETGVDDVSVSDKRLGDEYPYIVTFNGNQYGIKQNNEVEYLQGIYNRYICVTYVNEATPKYLFENTVTQGNVDKEVNGNNTPYTIIGVSNDENGEYVTGGTITGKSGELNIINLQNANFEYTLTNFFKGDEVFYVKIQIDNSIEKIQKITIAQGDEVTYEENFNGISYSGTWVRVEDENCSGNACFSTSTKGDSCNFSVNGSAYNIIYVLDEQPSRLNIYSMGSVNRIFSITNPGWEEKLYNKSLIDVRGEMVLIEGDEGVRQVNLGGDAYPGEIYIDSVVVCK